MHPNSQLPQKPETFRGLNYPFGRRAAPAPTEPVQIAPGVYWARFAMPMALNHINIWLLEDGDGWTVVDTCLDFAGSREQWQQLFQGFMGNKPVKRVICTHLHPDHVGLAGWLVEQFNTELWMTRSEFLMCHALVDDTGREAPKVALRFYQGAGYDEQQLQRYREKFGNFGRYVAPLPESLRRLVDRETIDIGGNYWQVIVGSGHSPEHACLYCPALKLLISGDQILPRITSNISVFPTEPNGNPLQEWLASCIRIRALLPDDLLVLPSHEAPFYGIATRLTQLIELHHRDLQALYQHLQEPRRAVDCFPALFKRTIKADDLGMATGETLAHLNYLLHSHQILREQDAQGVYWYSQLPQYKPFD